MGESAAWDEVPADITGMRKKALFDVFTPAAPVARREVFSGRQDQLAALEEVTMQRGQHAVIYGERGVGKTSLAKVARERAERDRMFSAHVTCDSTDTFASIWHKVLSEIRLTRTESGHEVEGAASDYLTRPVETPNDVRVVLSELSRSAPTIIYIDEYDVVPGQDARRAMAETIKVLSDQGINVTVVLVGVADSVTDLITQHESTERNLVQVQMPRLSLDERRQIIYAGLDVADMTITDEAAKRITLMSQGLAQFVHLLAQRAALVALADDGRTEVNAHDVQVAVRVALDDTHASVSSSYYEATKTNRPTTLYPSVMLACALVQPDERGFFTARNLVEPLSMIVGRPVDIPAFSRHLDQLASDRGPVLSKTGVQRKFRYRFRNPLMQPFVLLRGLSDGTIDYNDLQPR